MCHVSVRAATSYIHACGMCACACAACDVCGAGTLCVHDCVAEALRLRLGCLLQVAA